MNSEMNSKTTVCSQTLSEGFLACLLTKREQNNETVNVAGDAVGLAENRTVKFNTCTLNHEQGQASQETFKKEVTNMCDVIVTIGNPFMDSSNELTILDNHACMNETMVQALHSIERLENEQYSKYVNDVLIERKISIHKAIKNVCSNMCTKIRRCTG